VRFRLTLVALVLICTPLAVVWSVGIYEAIHRRATAREVRGSGEVLLEELARQRRPRGAWLHRFAGEHHVMIRVLDREGRLQRHTNPRDADRWSGVADWFRRAGNFFFGPAGPPDLLAYEATLAPEGQRREVRAALAGRHAEVWRVSRDRRMIVYYRALALPGRDGCLYLTRISRRNIRELYDLRYQVLKLTLVLAVVALALGAWSGWRVVNPLIRMQRAIRSYLRNPGSGLAAMDDLAVKRRDEIGDLSRDVRELANRLHGRVEQTASAAGDLAHDLKNPIATVAATSEVLEGGAALDPERRVRLARSLAQASEHMNRTVEGMLELARLEESMDRVERSVVDLTAVVQRVVESCRESPLLRAGVEVQLEAECKDAWVLGIAERLQQLLENLLDNALRFCRQRVVVRLRREQDWVYLQVEDDGPGVSPGHRERIFSRFFTSPAANETAPGTGLGLPIAHTIASAHHGELALLDRKEGQGACFELSLPEP
jgi:two-component system sensor histidine kinase ChvG